MKLSNKGRYAVMALADLAAFNLKGTIEQAIEAGEKLLEEVK